VVADGLPEHGEVARRHLAQLGEALGLALRVDEFTEVVLREGEPGLGGRIGDASLPGHAEGFGKARYRQRPLTVL
jgi:hypothetical protein